MSSSSTRSDPVRLRLTALAREFNHAARSEGLLPIKLTRFYREKVEAEMRELGHTDGPLCRCAVSVPDRLLQSTPGEVADFVDDRRHMPPELDRSAVRKYPDRMLFFPTERCLAHCQYCFRTDVLSEQHTADSAPTLNDRLDHLFMYLKEHREVREVILSGGDPLALPSSQFCELLRRLKREGGVEYLRVHTRALVFSPSVFTDSVCEALAESQVRLVHHIVHPYEICGEVRRFADRLRLHGVRCYNQFPLLRGVNDHVAVLARLLTDLDEAWIRNLSIFIPDPIKYSGAYRLGLSRLFGIIDALNTTTPAWVNATRVVLDTTVGKVRRENLVSWNQERSVALFTRDGACIEYPDLPAAHDVPGDIRQLLWRDRQ